MFSLPQLIYIEGWGRGSFISAFPHSGTVEGMMLVLCGYSLIWFELNFTV